MSLKQAFLKVAFVGAVLTLWLLLLALSVGAAEILLPVRRRPDGLYPSVDRMPVTMVAMAGSVWLANWTISLLFYATGLSVRRWSVFRRGLGG